jgi:hypothetical protein
MEVSAGCDEGTGGVDKGPRPDDRAEALGERGDPQREAKTWLEEPAKLERVRDGYHEQAAKGLMNLDKLKEKLIALEERRIVPSGSYVPSSGIKRSWSDWSGTGTRPLALRRPRPQSPRLFGAGGAPPAIQDAQAEVLWFEDGETWLRCR